MTHDVGCNIIRGICHKCGNRFSFCITHSEATANDHCTCPETEVHDYDP